MIVNPPGTPPQGQRTVAVIPVRNGELPAGGAEAVAEASGICVVIGSGVATVVSSLAGVARHVSACEVGVFAPLRWASALAPLIAGRGPLANHVVILPDNPDGRDLAPLLAFHLGRPLVTGAYRVDDHVAIVARRDGRAEHTVALDRPCVVTLRPGSRTVDVEVGADADVDHEVFVETVVLQLGEEIGDVAQLAQLAADPNTMDLADAVRIIAGGAGLGGPAHFGDLIQVGAAIGASVGATRVATDAGWIDASRQIGTTGVAVTPELYLAFGVSGAVQHVMGLGSPDHIVAVNLDPSCPMMGMADLAVVADAQAVLEELVARLAPSGSDLPS